MEKRVIKVQPLSEVSDEEFAPFGYIMGRERGPVMNNAPGFRYWKKNADLGSEPEKVDCGMFIATKEAKKVTFFERHLATSESFIPIEGEFIFVLAPTDNSKATPDTSKIQAFYLDGSLGASLKAGTWHYPPYPLGDSVKLVLFRKGKMAPMEVVDLKELDIDELVLSLDQ